MTVRETSLKVYHHIKAEGLLSRRRFQVYEALMHFGPVTANELFREMKKAGQTTTNNQQTNLTPRLGELRDLGVVREVRERECQVTGRTVIEWEVTDRLPNSRIPRKIPRVKALLLEIEALRAQLKLMQEKYEPQSRRRTREPNEPAHPHQTSLF